MPCLPAGLKCWKDSMIPLTFSFVTTALAIFQCSLLYYTYVLKGWEELPTLAFHFCDWFLRMVYFQGGSIAVPVWWKWWKCHGFFLKSDPWPHPFWGLWNPSFAFQFLTVRSKGVIFWILKEPSCECQKFNQFSFLVLLQARSRSRLVDSLSFWNSRFHHWMSSSTRQYVCCDYYI